MSKMSKKAFPGFHHIAIAKRITVMYGGIFSLSLLFLSGFMILNLSSMQQSTMRRELIGSAEEVRQYLDAGQALSDEALSELLEDIYVETNVYSYKEEKMYSSLMGEAPVFIQQPEGKKEKNAEEMEPPYLREKDLRDKGFRINVKRENLNGDVEYILENQEEQRFMLISSYYQTADGIYRIQVFRMLADGAYMLWNFMSKLLIADVIGILGAILIGKHISKLLLKPMAAIREAAERISIEDLSQRISTEGPDDEMKELTVTFNSMIDRLDTAFQRQNQFVSDASHELRTPISVIQGYANLVNRWGKSDPAVLQESIDSILTETDHMSALIQQLLFLAKGDQKKRSLQKTRISLNEVATELVREMGLLDESRSITLSERDTAEISADYDLIKQLLWIYGENALKYSPDGGDVEVRIWADETYGYVSVRDHGMGIAQEDLPKIFDRFYRADKSRNKEISGTGLGLAIAKWIVDSHDGEIVVESTVGEGTTVTTRFPLWEENS